MGHNSIDVVVAVKHAESSDGVVCAFTRVAWHTVG